MLTLKAATQEAHRLLEGLAIPAAGLSGMSLSDYQALIAHNYQLHLALEPSLGPWLDEHLPALAYSRQRLKLPALVADLASLDLKPGQIKTGPPVAITSLAQALGAAYVLEGATLGGQIIHRSLSSRNDLADQLALNYYGLYGPDIGTRWREFSQAVNERLSDGPELKTACQSARATFELAAEIFGQTPFTPVSLAASLPVSLPVSPGAQS